MEVERGESKSGRQQSPREPANNSQRDGAGEESRADIEATGDIDGLLASTAPNSATKGCSRGDSGNPRRKTQPSAPDKVIVSVNTGAKISRVNHQTPPPPPPPPNSQLDQAKIEEEDNGTDIALTSMINPQKKTKRAPRYTIKTFSDCPCALCRPKARKSPELTSNKTQNKSMTSQSPGSQPDELEAERLITGESEEPTPKPQEPPKPVVIPVTKTEIEVIQSKGGVSINSEHPVTDIPQTIVLQRYVDYTSIQASSLLWRVDKVESKIRAARSEDCVTIYSQTFYTAPHGYRMLAATCPFGTGTGRGKHLPIFFFVCRGKYDTLLPWPFRAKITVKLLDQNAEFSERKHMSTVFSPDPENETLAEALKQPTKERNNYFGVGKFAPLKVLSPSKHTFVRDDIMFIQVYVERDEMPVL